MCRGSDHHSGGPAGFGFHLPACAPREGCVREGVPIIRAEDIGRFAQVAFKFGDVDPETLARRLGGVSALIFGGKKCCPTDRVRTETATVPVRLSTSQTAPLR